MSIKRWFKGVMAELGYTPTAYCAAESALADKRLAERQDQLDQAIDERETARTLAELLRSDVARLERERDEALTAAEIHQANREMWKARATKSARKPKQKGGRGESPEHPKGRGTVRSVAKKRKAA